MRLAEFNALTRDEASAVASVWAAVPTWVDGIVAARPYPSVDALADAAALSARDWTAVDLDAALAHHPRIGERPRGSGAEATASRSEQASLAAADDDVAARIAAGNAAYEKRFGRVFLIRAAGRSPEEMLGELERRLGADEDDEVREACDQLAQIAALRLRGAVTDTDTAPSDGSAP